MDPSDKLKALDYLKANLAKGCEILSHELRENKVAGPKDPRFTFIVTIEKLDDKTGKKHQKAFSYNFLKLLREIERKEKWGY